MRSCTRNPKNTSKGYNYISSRKQQVKRSLAQKIKMKCKGGVLDGHTLHLSSAGTLPFSIGGIKGYYDTNMGWIEI